MASLLSACWLPWPRPRRPGWAGKVFARFEVSASAMNNTTQNTLLYLLLLLLLRHSTLISSWSHISAPAHTHTLARTHTHPQPVGSTYIDCLEHLHCFVIVVLVVLVVVVAVAGVA